MKTRLLAALATGIFLLAAFSVLGTASATPPGTVYTETNASSGNQVLAYQSGPNGVLSLVGTFSTGEFGTGSALASQGAVQLTQYGQWLLVVDAGNNYITVFQVHGDGSLTVADNVYSQGTTPISLTINSNIVFVLNSGGTPNIAGFTLSNNGVLTATGSTEPLSGLTGASPEQIGFVNTTPPGPGPAPPGPPAPPGGPGAGVLVVTEKGSNVIDTYTVSGTGFASAPTVTVANGEGPYGFASTPQGYLVLTEAATGTLSSYAVSNNGNLRTLSGAIPDFGNSDATVGGAPCWVTLSNNGQFAYVSNAHVGSISVYGISGAGTLSLISSISAHTGVPTLDLAVSGNNQFLYALNGNSLLSSGIPSSSDQITAFQIYADGSIAQVAAPALPAIPSSAAGLAAT